jgi:hypothetical protein
MNTGPRPACPGRSVPVGDASRPDKNGLSSGTVALVSAPDRPTARVAVARSDYPGILRRIGKIADEFLDPSFRVRRSPHASDRRCSTRGEFDPGWHLPWVDGPCSSRHARVWTSMTTGRLGRRFRTCSTTSPWLEVVKVAIADVLLLDQHVPSASPCCVLAFGRAPRRRDRAGPTPVGAPSTARCAQRGARAGRTRARR